MTSFAVLTKEEIDQELSPDEIEEQENCNSEQINDLASPFSNFLKNLLGGGGRQRKTRIQGILKKFIFQKCSVFKVSAQHFPLWRNQDRHTKSFLDRS